MASPESHLEEFSDETPCRSANVTEENNVDGKPQWGSHNPGLREGGLGRRMSLPDPRERAGTMEEGL